MSILVHDTMNYDLFSFMKGNRNINELHVERLKKSMRKKYMIVPILVNENLEIIDGQHRFSAEKELGLPIYYIMQEGYGLEECHMLNVFTKKYTPQDFLEGYAVLGKSDYTRFKEFQTAFPFLSIHLCQIYLTGGRRRDKQDTFKSGDFKIENYDRAVRWAEMAREFREYSGKFFTNRNFHTALLKLFRHKNYNHQKMLQKMNLRSSELRHSAKEKFFIEDLCYIYNHGTRESDRIHPYELTKI